MGASGADLLLSPAARALFPFYTEAKNQEALNIWAALEQAEKGAFASAKNVDVSPIVVFRRNHSPTYVALHFDVLLEFLREIARHSGVIVDAEG